MVFLASRIRLMVWYRMQLLILTLTRTLAVLVVSDLLGTAILPDRCLPRIPLF